ncbi:MAG TPA: hypothetical protein ENF82_04275, partial [Candidatus Methanomethylia archaeon]|nr:hypothetical protein [Candidatus Methanomethylicia archaeon]
MSSMPMCSSVKGKVCHALYETVLFLSFSRRGKMEFVKLYVLHLRQCDPSKCTALRLAKSKLIHLVNKLSDLPGGSVVLFPHPFADVVLAPMDRELIISRGLSAIDCS